MFFVLFSIMSAGKGPKSLCYENNAEQCHDFGNDDLQKWYIRGN